MNRKKIARPLAREHMPADYRISLDAYLGRAGLGNGLARAERRIPDDYGARQSMRGFEASYQNIIDYIVRITHRIWEEGDLEYIGDTYADDCRIYDDYGLQTGSAKIIADTRARTGAFTNIRLLADEIVWAGDDDSGYHTSHRIITQSANSGASLYGPAANKDSEIFSMANCVVLENEIFLEHVLHDYAGLVAQLGLDVERVAAKLAADPPAGWPKDSATWQALRGAAAPARPISVADPAPGFDVDAFVRDSFDTVWNRRGLDDLARIYDPNFRFHGSWNRKFTGLKPYSALLAALFTAFPDMEPQVDEVYWMGNEQDGFLSAVRWSADATHKGAGLYGEPTGRAAQLWGMTQHKIINGRIVNEWLLFNELDLMMQIAAARS